MRKHAASILAKPPSICACPLYLPVAVPLTPTLSRRGAESLLPLMIALGTTALWPAVRRPEAAQDSASWVKRFNSRSIFSRNCSMPCR